MGTRPSQPAGYLAAHIAAASGPVKVLSTPGTATAHTIEQETRRAGYSPITVPASLLDSQTSQKIDRQPGETVLIIDDAERSNPYIRLQADKLLQHPKLRSVFVIYNQ